MIISRVRIENYKSFEDSGWIDLAPGTNVIVGQNNAGKSAFIDLFRMGRGLSHIPHMSARRPFGEPVPNRSIFWFSARIAGDEVRREALRVEPFQTPATVANTAGAEAFFTNLFQTGFVLEASVGAGESLSMQADPPHGLFIRPADNSGVRTARVYRNRQWRGFERYEVVQAGAGDGIPELAQNTVNQRVFVADAQRTIPGRSPAQDSTLLSANAGNLPSVLMRLQGSDPNGFEGYLALVRKVLPSVEWIGVRAQGSECLVSIWTDPSRRIDLGIPLERCGTGVAQVLAIIYAVQSTEHSVIVIDEPNSFLHPGATKALMQIFKSYPEHQFIISTHSPDIISTLRPDRILTLSFDKSTGQTLVSTTEVADFARLKDILDDLGTSLTDVFGFQRIIFVEGATEAACFPLVADSALAVACNFVAMRDASAVGRRNPAELFDIYIKGVRASSLTPPTALFSFDRDGRTEKAVEDLVRASKGTAFFLKRPMFENYLLHDAAIALVLSQIGCVVTPDEVKVWIDTNIHRFAGDKPDRAVCNAAGLLGALWTNLSTGLHAYHKISTGEALVKAIMAVDAAALAPLRDHVNGLLTAAASKEEELPIWSTPNPVRDRI